MKKTLAVLLAAVMVFSLAACAGSAQESGGDTETTRAAETTAPETEQPTEAAESAGEDDALIAETKAKLIGDWSYPGMEDYVRLTFNEDGTGSYIGLDDTFTFSYSLEMAHKTFGNGEPYIDKTLTVFFSNGETEEIVINFREDSREELTFHNTDGGGYNGRITDYGAWMRVQQGG